jgi:hypothetical protein
MAHDVIQSISHSSRAYPHARWLVLCFAASLLVVPAQAKNASLTAIELYTGPDGPAYVHITDVLINGKSDLRVCDSVPKIDKSAYARLAKITLSTGTSIEYGNDGTLTLARDSASSCVVPSELKFDKNGPLTPAELASRAVLQGKVLSAANGAVDAPPPLKPGVKLIFVSAPDIELAEFLRADRASTIPWFQDYLSRYPASAHTAQAKQFLVALLLKEGEKYLETYGQSAGEQTLYYKDLGNAKLRAEQALAVIPVNPAALKLDDAVHEELQKLIDKALGELDSYKKALGGRTAGYGHLVAASELANAVADIDSKFAPAVSLKTDAISDEDAMESSLRSAESFAASRRFDEGFSAIAAYTSFAGEVPRIATFVDQVYHFHFDRGQELASAQDWDGALKQFQMASGVRQTPEVKAAIKNAGVELEIATNKNAAAAAVRQSQAFEEQHNYIQAYELLSNLPSPQRALVAAELEHLTPAYIEGASLAAKGLQQAHDPIRGLADETSMELAFGYLQRAYALGNDPNIKDRMDSLSDKLSEYYLQQAKRYMDKPLGSGAGLGWSYLNKALDHKASNIAEVRDEMTRAASAYQLRSKLSIRVQFRDQTSRRDSAGFADQLADAIATGLETSGLPVKVIRPGETPAYEPNFQLVGDVIQHRHTMVPTSEPKDSKYRAGEQEIPNDDWNKANREYEAASLELQSAQGALQGIVAHGKKKEIDAANDRVSSAQAKVVSAHAKLDSIPKTIPMDIIKPYTYTQKDLDLSAVVQLQFRIIDSSGNQIEGNVPISREANQKFTILENVKPEDTEGIKSKGTVPDDIQFLTDVENDARDALIKAAKEGTAKLPEKILERARKRAEEGDLDGAAEAYILYLNSTPAVQSPERQQAERFLLEQYNIRNTFSSSS